MSRSRMSALQPEATPHWKPKHKIFLSHSGVQKPFTERLCEKLEAVQHFPFFDKRLDSLRKGERFYPPLMKAAEECLVAILVLSDDFFTNSKWPMMELNMFVKAQESNNKRLKILPLFYKISRKEFNKRKDGQDWMSKWEDFKKLDESINLFDWRYAVSKIQGNNGIEYGGENEGEGEFIKKVVAAVCKLDVPADVRWDTSHFQSMETLLEPVLNKVKEIGPSDVHKVQVMGLHGMGGVGKTTLTREVCNRLVGDFAGKVCHVELGGKNLKEQMKRVLKVLTGADLGILDVEHDELAYLLKERMGLQKVFLVLDNIWDNDIEEVEKYLKVGYHDGSMVLLVSRTIEILATKLCIPMEHCMEMPNLDEEGAVDVFLHYASCTRESIKSSNEWEIVKRCMKECYFVKKNKEHEYHPLALKVVGIYVKSMKLEAWEESLKVDKFNMLKEKRRSLFSVLRIGYDALEIEEQYIFLDLALIWRSKFEWHLQWKWRFEWNWLCIMYVRSEGDMKKSVDTLLRRGLLESVHDIEELDFVIHDLYVEFAEEEAQAGPFERRRFLLNKYDIKVPYELLVQPSNNGWLSLKRFVMHNNGARTLKRAKLYHCMNVEVLDLHQCRELEELDIGGMTNLRCIVVTDCAKLERWLGLDQLSDLVILRCLQCPVLKEFIDSFTEINDLQILDVSGCISLTSLKCIACAPALQKVDASWCNNLRELPDDFSGLKQLQSLVVSGCKNLTSLKCIACAPALQKVDASWCNNLRELLDDFSGLKQLQSFVVSGCENLTSLKCIACAPALQKVDASWCNNLRELPDDFSGLKQLQSLKVSRCENLTSLKCIACAPALQKVDASWCKNLRELPDDFSGLK